MPCSFSCCSVHKLSNSPRIASTGTLVPPALVNSECLSITPPSLTIATTDAVCPECSRICHSRTASATISPFSTRFSQSAGTINSPPSSHSTTHFLAAASSPPRKQSCSSAEKSAKRRSPAGATSVKLCTRDGRDATYPDMVKYIIQQLVKKPCFMWHNGRIA